MTPITLIPLGDLLEDKTFRKFFTETPPMYPHQAARSDGWRLWVRFNQTSPWRRKDVTHYQSGVDYVLPRIEDGSIHNAVLQCRGVSYKPPTRRFLVRDPKTGKPMLVVDGKGNVSKKVVEKVWAPSSELIQEYGPHDWCFYCRRPTVFAYFRKHHAFIGTPLEPYFDGSIRRCAVCGISHDNYRRY